MRYLLPILLLILFSCNTVRKAYKKDLTKSVSKENVSIADKGTVKDSAVKYVFVKDNSLNYNVKTPPGVDTVFKYDTVIINNIIFKVPKGSEINVSNKQSETQSKEVHTKENKKDSTVSKQNEKKQESKVIEKNKQTRRSPAIFIVLISAAVLGGAAYFVLKLINTNK